MLHPAKEMLSSLLRPRPAVRRDGSHLASSNSATPSPSPAHRNYADQRHATADFTEADDDEEDEDDFDVDQPSGPRVTRFAEDGATQQHSASMIPLFSTDYLDSLPVYHIVHAIRIIVQTRSETTLTWEQLCSPQVSQFLVKPMQQQIRTQHFSRVTMYALMANCLQFAKEGQLYPSNSGVSNTRAKVCELLALKMLKEYTTKELIDALSYDFDPLQGAPAIPTIPNARVAAAARTSTLEVAIRASAKHFLAHPLVVQQLEAIWNGAISFYSSHDSLHRTPPPLANAGRSNQRGPADARTPLLGRQPVKEHSSQLPLHAIPVRRTVNLYDPRNASPLKLSRLRVPRYRQFLATCSLFILICLFLAVLVERSSRITTLELIFWFWSAGFMLDEVVGFNEQGFSLYIMSFWNIFDLGILLLLIIYYCMRVYGVFLIDPHRWNDMAYDVLAANAILLLPRIFSVLDHYPYFSQLLIAFRLMAVDLAAVFVLVLISCSGFFVFFTLSKNQNDAPDVAYKIFQILMGFTPAAWEVWPEYNFIGRLLLVLFLIICHFLVVTILITVLTNSFMAIASNAKEEHQFLFAINTISMVKNDALFSYIAPANIFAWLLMPFRYVMPIRQFVLLNRMVIKLTHWPLLFCIFLYEKYILASTIYEPTDLVDNHGRAKSRAISFADPASRGAALFSPGVRIREESVAGLQKDRALDEVFRRQPGPSTIRNQRRMDRRKTQTAIRTWMDQNDDPGEQRLSRWPTIESHSHRHLSVNRDIPRRFRTVSDVRSAASDPADLISNSGFHHTDMRALNGQIVEQQAKDQTDADGDDELVTNDEDDDDDIAAESRRGGRPNDSEQEDYFTTPIASRHGVAAPSSLGSSFPRQQATGSPRAGGNLRRQGLHSRTMSTNTILYNPQEAARLGQSPTAISEEPLGPRSRPKTSRLVTTMEQSTPSGTRSPRRTQYVSTPSRPKPIPMKTAPNRTALHTMEPRRVKASSDVEITSEMGLDANNDFGAVPASFATQMAMATGQLRGLGRGTSDRENSDRMSRLVLARMKTLEESFADVVREMRVMRSTGPTAQNSGDDGSWRGSAGLATPANRRLPRTDKADRSRPVSVREDEVGMGSGASSPRKQRVAKGKGKSALRSEESSTAGEVEDRRLRRRGSSF
ncbi:Uu.00g051700.m01.CDS01 [Anthostomella pinea]|uniref:Uu.00g051700.m01.CDS01 n=1 Tax=Anthostomella pinea TaxID=933095 RepID=A0AAI8YPE6_9PEZI|nr:Uu.00g051700.m01.CDS01 [Anthostomella pinea]